MPLAHRVRPGSRVRLDEIPTDGDGGYADKDDPRVAADLAGHLRRLAELQERLFAERGQALLVVFQALDAAGKDGAIRKVVGPLDSRGVYVWSFKAPVGDEAEHDYLWRVHARCPRRGEITVFNRSHYEDLLVARVMGLVPEARWKRRFDHVVAFEAMLRDEGTRVVKFYLHIGKDEQRARLQERLDDPEKRWKFDPRDLEMRARWGEFREAYEDVLSRTSTDAAPWYVVPADRKWHRDLAVAETLVTTLEEMDPRYPEPTYDPKATRVR